MIKDMTILGREPAVIVAVISAGLQILVGFGLTWLSVEQAGLIVAAISAVLGVVVALATRPVAPAVFTTLVTTVAALLTAYGMHFSQEMVSSINVFVLAVLTLVTRHQVTPVVAAPREVAARPQH
jgi:hypothetical protein